MRLKLKAPKNRGRYKTDKGYIDAVYRTNKDIIDLSLDTAFVSGRSAFGANIREIKRDKNLQRKLGKKASEITVKEAIDYLAKTQIFTSMEEHGKENFLQGIRKFKDEIKELRRKTGWNDKLDANNLHFDENVGMYVYSGSKGSVYIDTSDSPERLLIYDFNKK